MSGSGKFGLKEPASKRGGDGSRARASGDTGAHPEVPPYRDMSLPVVKRVEARLDAIEVLLATGQLPWQAERWARENFGVKRSQPKRYVQKVQERWAKRARESPDESPEQRRERVRAMLYQSFRRCGELDHVPGALGAGLKAMELLIRFEGLDSPDINLTQVNICDVVGKIQQAYALQGLANRALEQRDAARLAPSAEVVVAVDEEDGDG